MPLLDYAIPAAIARILRLPGVDAKSQQLRVLKRLMHKAKYTEFGQQFNFDTILMS